jgi:hypothetical protein
MLRLCTKENMGQAISVATHAVNMESNTQAQVTEVCSQAGPCATASTPIQVAAGRRQRSKGFFMRRTTLLLMLCLAVVVRVMAATVTHEPGSRMFGWPSLRETIVSRASVELAEDFRQDLRRWAGKEGWSNSWLFNGRGYAIPGQLAIHIGSVPLADYRMEFAGQVDRQALGFVYRAMDFDNYYAARIVIVNRGSMPEAVLERYAVIDGQAGPKTQVTLPISVRMDTQYNVEVEAKGEHFLTRVNNQVVDAFSDSRLPSGGVGFFANAGDSARISWLRLSNHDDLLGKICSWLAPVS